MIISNVWAQSSLPPTPGATTSTQAQPSNAGAPVGAPPQPSPLSMLLPFGLMFVVVYFLMIRPQQKKMKEHQAVLEKIKHGDEVLLNSGFFGTVTGVNEKVLTVEIANNVRVKVLKSQVATINPDLSKIQAVEKGA